MIPTREEELEAAIWQAMKVCGATVGSPLRFIELLTFAAQRYAAGDSEVLAELRRKVLERDTAEQTTASTSGGVTGTATEQNPPGSVAYSNGSGDGGATSVHRDSIPEPVTSGDREFSTGQAENAPGRVAGYPQGVDR